MAIIAVLMIPTELGLPQLVMREVSAARALDGVGATTAIVRWARKTVVLTSSVIAMCFFSVIKFDLVDIEPTLQGVLLIGLLWVPVVAVGNIYGAALRGEHKVVSGQLGEVILRPAVVSLMLAAVTWLGVRSLTAGLAMGINVAAACIAAGFSIAYLRISSRGGRREVARLPDSLNFSESFPIAMAEGTRVLAGQMSVLVLAAMVTQSDVGLYRVASAVYIAAAMPSTLINIVCAPAISRFFSRDEIGSVARLNLWVSAFLMTTAAVAVLLHIIFGRAAISALFGHEYADAANLLLILLTGELVGSLFGHPVVVLNMMRHQRAVMWCSMVALAVNFVIAITLIGAIGYIGAAVGTAVGMIIWRMSCAIYAKRRLGLDTSWVTRAIPARVSI